VAGYGYTDTMAIPIIENAEEEGDMLPFFKKALEENPKTHAVLVRRHGAYIWGATWSEAKKHAECYEYLFKAAFRMKQLGLNWEVLADA